MEGKNKSLNSETGNKAVGQSKYDKGATAGVEGTIFQINLLMVALLNAFQNFTGWKLSTENKCYGKFDDVILELPEGAVLLQAKHRKSGKLPSNELFSVNSKHNDFSLGKYFFSYEEIKDQSQIKNVVICTNAILKMDAEMRKFLNRETDNSDNFLYYGKACSYYTFNDSILPKLEDHVKSYHSENLKNKNIDGIVTPENLKDFLTHLQFYCGYPCEKKLNTIIEQLFSGIEYAKDLYGESSSKYLYNRVLDWFREPQGIHLEECHVKAIISEMRSIRYCETLEKYQTHFQDTNLAFKDTCRILHVISEDSILLNVLKIYRVLQSNNKTSATTLYVNSRDSIYLQHFIEVFEVPQYTHLIIICPKLNQIEINEMSTKLEQVLKRTKHYKKVILVTNRNDKFALEMSKNSDIFDTLEEHVTFKNLSKYTQDRLLKDKNITFQGENVSLEELFATRTFETCEQVLDSPTIEKLVMSERVTVGSSVQALEKYVNYYIGRQFKKEGQWKDGIIPEENICDVEDRWILIADSAGTGKSTVLTNLAVTIKKKMPHLWVLKINIIEYSRVLYEFRNKNKKTISITDLLESVDTTKFKSAFERRVFSLDQKVLLMVDAIDEISPNYTELILNLLTECQNAPNFTKMIVTTRLDVVEKLQQILNVKPLTLLPFTRDNQIDFLINYWTRSLEIEEEEKKKKCRRYAVALIFKMSLWMKYKQAHNFSAIPLHLKMLAEIFGTVDEQQKSLIWKGCKEYLEDEEGEPKFPEKMDLAKLYKMFISKNQHMFVTRGNPNGIVAADLALNTQYIVYLDYHRSFALTEVLGEIKREYFSSYQQVDIKNIEPNMLKVGLVQISSQEPRFVHRTFAEFFVAETILIELQKQQTNPDTKFQKFFIDVLLARSDFYLIHVFLDNLLQDVLDSLSTDIFLNRQFFSHRIKINKSYNVRLIHLLAGEGCVMILHFLLKCIRFKIVSNKNMQIADFKYTKYQLKSPNTFCVDTLNFMKYLLDQVGVNFGDRSCTMPIEYAIQNGHLRMVEFLVENGADLNYKRGVRCTALWEAVRTRNKDIVDYLLSHGADPDEICVCGLPTLICGKSQEEDYDHIDFTSFDSISFCNVL